LHAAGAFFDTVFSSETTLVQTAATTRASSRSAGGSGSAAPGASSAGAVLGIVFANGAVFTFTVMDAVIKEVS
jgi:hypothetical protein